MYSMAAQITRLVGGQPLALRNENFLASDEP
jgi:hypothetical protein